jgi:hypothetical protein
MGLPGLGLILWSSVASITSFRAEFPITLASCKQKPTTWYLNISHQLSDLLDEQPAMDNNHNQFQTVNLEF